MIAPGSRGGDGGESRRREHAWGRGWGASPISESGRSADAERMATETASLGPDAGPATGDRRGTAVRTLRRCPHHRMLGGVAAGAADYFDLDVTAVRVGFVILALIGGIGLPLYLAAWFLVPEEDAESSIAEEFLDWYRGR